MCDNRSLVWIKFGDNLFRQTVNKAHIVLILCCFYSASFLKSSQGGRSLAQSAIGNIATSSPDGVRRRLTSDAPRYRRHWLIATSTHTRQPASAAFCQSSEAAKRWMKSRPSARGAAFPGLLGLPPTAAAPQRQ